jgi:hypothetical protein
MTHQVPSSRVAETQAFAGPWLRFQSGTGPGSTSWTGSVLCVTRAAPATAGSGAAAPRAPQLAPPATPRGGANGSNGRGPMAAGGGGSGGSGMSAASGAGAPAPELIFKDSNAPGGGSDEEQRLQPSAGRDRLQPELSARR